MNKVDIIKEALKKSQFKDYTYLILFFIVSSFFALWVIRPVLSLAISLQREGKDLQKLNKVYQDNIVKALQIQSQLEVVRNKRYLLEEALPEGPRVNSLIDEVRNLATSKNVVLKSVSISGINIKGEADTKRSKTHPLTKSLEINMTIAANFNEANSFIQSLIQQRRIKSINSVIMTKEKKVKDEAQLLRLVLDVEAYYL